MILKNIVSGIGGMEQKKDILLITALWILLTAVNINKAFHIDDTFHLKAAGYIVDHPLSPMSGQINWNDNPSPLYIHNQPPLFFFLLAAFIKFFGESEICLHLLTSFFTFLALFWFYKITGLMQMKKKRTVLIVFSFCPALIINQNLMVDVPILAILLGTLFYTLKAGKQDSLKNHIFAAILLSFGLLIKYTLLPVIPVLLINYLISGERKKAWIVFIPVLTLALWSGWNYLEFGSAHLLNRSKNSFQPIRIYEFIACLGALATFLPTFLYGSVPTKTVRYLLYVVFAFYAILSVLKFFDLSEFPYYGDLDHTFIIMGVIIWVTIIAHSIRNIRNKNNPLFLYEMRLILLYLLFLSLFIIFFSPFIATRHILLIIPLLLITGYEFFERADKYINALTIFSTVSLGLILGVSDWKYADFYRKTAAMIKISPDQNVWSCGHWGWQWYSEKAGMKIYAKDNVEAIKMGDYFAYPKDVAAQQINKTIKIQTVDKITLQPDVFTFFSVHHFASMYKSEYHNPPWRLSGGTIDTIIVAKVIGISE